MNKTQAIHKTKVQTTADAGTEVSRTAVAAIGITGGLIGVWAVTCLFSGMIASGGSGNMVASLFKAITG